MRWLTPLLIGLLVLLQIPLWFGEGGWLKVLSHEKEVEQQEALNAKLRIRNETLTAEVLDLKEAQDAIEERARSELGMVRPGEIFVRVVPGKVTSEQTSR